MNHDIVLPDHKQESPAATGSLPPLPPRTRTSRLARLKEDFLPLEEPFTLARLIDALLKRPGQMAHVLTHNQRYEAGLLLLATTLAGMALYGFIMGTFSGGAQLWLFPLKVTVGFLFCGLLCLPSLYIFASLCGARQSLGDMAFVLLSALALCALLMVGFAPITWVFSQSTQAAFFMGALHVAFFAGAVRFALRQLRTVLSVLNESETAALRAWGLLFLVVVLQMCTTLRPLVGPFDGFAFQEKQFFLAHWLEAASNWL